MFVLDSIPKMMNVMREGNVTLRWLMLHTCALSPSKLMLHTCALSPSKLHRFCSGQYTQNDECDEGRERHTQVAHVTHVCSLTK